MLVFFPITALNFITILLCMCPAPKKGQEKIRKMCLIFQIR